MRSCNCLEERKADLLRIIAERHPEMHIVEGDFVQLGLFLAGRVMDVGTFTEFEVTYTSTKKDGSESKPRRQKADIIHSFCPFCGTPTGAGEPSKKATGEEAAET